MQEVISVFLYVLGLALCPKTRSILENVRSAAEKNVCSVAFGQRSLSRPFDPFKTNISCLVFVRLFCLLVSVEYNVTHCFCAGLTCGFVFHSIAL